MSRVNHTPPPALHLTGLRHLLAQGSKIELIADGSDAYILKETRRDKTTRVLKSPKNHDKKALMLIRNEARVLAGLSHPNIIRLDAFEGTDEHPYLVLEDFDGMDLGKYVSLAYGFRPQLAIAIVCQVARAIAYMHRSGFIHGDVKPENVLLYNGSLLGSYLQVKVIDLAFAREPGRKLLIEKQEQAITCTLQYHPAQYLIEAKSPDDKSDLYGLGILAFELLTGQPAMPPRLEEAAGKDFHRTILGAQENLLTDIKTRKFPSTLEQFLTTAVASSGQDLESAEQVIATLDSIALVL